MTSKELKYRTDPMKQSVNMSSVMDPFCGSGKDDFRRWETRFDKELNNPGVLTAWQTLIHQQCDSRALKSVLYRAARWLALAQEIPGEWAAYSQTRKAALHLSVELKQKLQELMALRVGRGRLVDLLLSFYVVEEKDVAFFERFPILLERFQRILNQLVAIPPSFFERHSLSAFITDVGEALLHIYVEETTGRLFSEETAVLLEAAAASYGLEGPCYSAAAVNRRHQRFRTRRPGPYKVIRLLVRFFRSKDNLAELRDSGADIDLGTFIDAMFMKLYYGEVLDYLRGGRADSEPNSPATREGSRSIKAA